VRCAIIVGRDEPVSLMGVAVHPVEQIMTQDGTRSS
jgi:hypothetical protein